MVSNSDYNMKEAEEEEEGEESDEQLNIARRTRSHLRIENFVPNDNLDFPDVDMNLYQNQDSEGDTEYKKFLNQCYSEELNTDNTNNNDDNDPEYVYNDDIFSHGWRFDLSEIRLLHQGSDSRDSQKYQTNLLLTGDPNSSYTFNQQQNNVAFNSTNEQSNYLQLTNPRQTSPIDLSTGHSQQAFKSNLKESAKRRLAMFEDPQFARVLNQQLRQHIQLLTQTYLLAKNTTNMHKEADEAKRHLNQYKMIFENKNKPSNLLPALNLVNNLQTPKDLKSSIRLSWRPLPIPEIVKRIIHEKPEVFVYHSLKPQVAFSILPEKLVPKKPKINFTINEDKLLAYALNEFKGESTPYAFIASLLMVAKTKTQISNHIKNIKRSPGNEDNPIKLYFSEGRLPEIDLDSDSEIIEVEHEFIYLKPEMSDVEHEKSDVDDEESFVECKEDAVQQDSSSSKRENLEVEQANTIDNNRDLHNNESIFQKIDVDEKQMIESLSVEPKSDNSVRIVDVDNVILAEDHDDLMNMDLDDLMAASTTISKTKIMTSNNGESSRSIKNLKLKESMLNMMSHNFLLPKDMGDLIIFDFLKTAQQKLDDMHYQSLLELLTEMMTKKKIGDQVVAENEKNQIAITIYHELTGYLKKISAPKELLDRVVLFLDLDQASKCGCSFSYLHWLRFFKFMQHVELYNDGVEAFEKKLCRLIDALQKDDSHKIKLAIGNLINKHPFLKREFESLSLDEKPHPSLFICEEDFDDITEPITMFDIDQSKSDSIHQFEHFNPKLTKEELNYASQACPCKCHPEPINDGQLTQHCTNCNLKFMKGRMYLVSKIKPILAEWNYTPCLPGSNLKTDAPNQSLSWTLEEDREILEFCRMKAEQNEETVSFDTATFEELVSKRPFEGPMGDISSKKSAREIAERFNYLMDMYKDENSNNLQ